MLVHTLCEQHRDQKPSMMDDKMMYEIALRQNHTLQGMFYLQLP